jgi:3-deoxy-D-manno-octulosonic-acid transferase
MIYFYHLLSLFVATLLLPLFSLIALSSKHKWKGLAHHFGWVPFTKKSTRKVIWLHALSMGEVVAATPVLKLVREQNPEFTIALSVTTDSGYTAALKMNIADNVFFHPFDCLPFTLLALKRINPDLHVVTDTGFWPGLIDLLHRKKTPILLFNGRISEKSARRYLLAGSLFKDTFQKFHHFGMQNNIGEKVALTLGVDPERIEVMGDPKYDAQQPLTDEEKQQLRKTFKLETGTPLWIAGSTHAGEEEIILDAHQQLTAKHPNLVLILAPRRIERVKEVVTLIKKRNISFTLRSSMKLAETVILLDTMGELGKVYSLGQVALIGKSLVKPGGGHSLIEPLSYGLPVLHGPFVENIGHVADKAHELGLAITVQDSNNIKEKVHNFLENKKLRQKLAENALSFTTEQKGASKKMAEIITKTLVI